MLEIERGSTRSQSVGNVLRKRLWTCSKTDNRMNDGMGTHEPLIRSSHPGCRFSGVLRSPHCKNPACYTMLHWALFLNRLAGII
jgi:hypothetical protein